MNNNFWSTYIQDPDFLDSSRMKIMNADLVAYVAEKLALRPGMRVLDVGCGTGAFGFYLSRASERVQYTGIDTDEELIAAARRKASLDERGNRFVFLEGNAAKLPFPDDSFDAVVSHTFLTASVCYEAAMREMKRVCKPGGTIGTINIADFTKIICHRASSQSESGTEERYNLLLEKFQKACECLCPVSKASEGISPDRIPAFFTSSGLGDICVYPIGSFFSLSNSEQLLPRAAQKLYLDRTLSSLLKRISVYAVLPGFFRYMPECELEELRELASARHDVLSAGAAEDAGWDYDAYLYLLVTGKNDSEKAATRSQSPQPSLGRKEKYKDARPEDTLRHIRSVLDKAGLKTSELFTGSGMEGLYSCRVTVEGTDMGQNGKGTTPEYALASGYAEFMERLSTGYLVPFEAPDREILSVESCIEEGGEMLKTAFSRLYDIPLFMADAAHILQQWGFAEEETDTGRGFPGYHFTGIRGDKSVFLPEFLYRNFVYTNGSCAGNTREEAMVQGLSEIMERYAMLRILADRLSPPVIPEDELKEHPGGYGLVRTIRQQTGMKLFVLDASLGQGLPVVCAVLLDLAEKKVCVRFGAHPCFEVALERTLTELLQGRHAGRITGMCPIGAEFEQNTTSPENLFNLLKVGFGTISVRILDGISKEPDWSHRPWEEIDGGNPELLARLLSLCERLQWDVYYRDCNFFSFPVYHMFIPQCSMIMNHGKADIARAMMRTKYLKDLRNFPGANEEAQQKALLTAKLYAGLVLHENLDMLSGVGFHARIDDVKINYTLLAALYDIEKKEYGQAAEKLKHHSGLNETLWCLRELCAAEQNSLDISFFLASMVRDPASLEAAKQILKSPYSVLPHCTFPNCGGCERKELCDAFRVRSAAGLK